ncbi:MAG: endolytic transglycosylase MltG [Ruminobacter sp.]|nr:endolytic transglycosylase MltG [Ruminobacter sp.]
MKIFIYILLVLVLLLGGVSYFGYSYVKEELSTIETLKTTNTTLYTVKKGSQASKVISDLFKKDINSYVLRYWLKENSSLTNIKVGTYEIKEGMTIRDTLDLIVKGIEKSYNITLVEGDTLDSFIKTLNKNPNLVHNLPQNVSYSQIVQILKLEEKYPEGLFLPDTYNFSHGDDDISILKRSNKAMKELLEKEYKNRDSDLPYKSPYEVLIMASIIEKESAQAKERPIIASVFINRLKRGVKLQTDPTVIYGVRDRYKGKILKSHLDDKNAYNTYVIDGLPITPIATPSKESIMAALHPAKTNYMFFVAKGPDSREGHVFSENVKQHEKAVSAYRLSVKNYKENLKNQNKDANQEVKN